MHWVFCSCPAMNKRMPSLLQVGGPGGLLRLVINCTKQLAPPAAAQKQQQQTSQGAAAAAASSKASGGGSSSRRMSEAAAAAKAKQSSYCQVRLGQVVLRTPIAHHTAAEDAVWNWQLSLALPVDLAALTTTPPAAAASDATVCSFSVYEAQTMGDPVLLGKTRVSLVICRGRGRALVPVPGFIAAWQGCIELLFAVKTLTTATIDEEVSIVQHDTTI
jgi:hypothetical protein